MEFFSHAKDYSPRRSFLIKSLYIPELWDILRASSGISLALFDSAGILLARPVYAGKFCQVTQKSFPEHIFQKRCLEFYRKAFQDAAAAGIEVEYTCFCGLKNYIFPIKLDTEIAAYLLFGPLLTEKPYNKHLENLRELLRNKKILNLYKKIEIVRKEKINKIVKIFQSAFVKNIRKNMDFLEKQRSCIFADQLDKIAEQGYNLENTFNEISAWLAENTGFKNCLILTLKDDRTGVDNIYSNFDIKDCKEAIKSNSQHGLLERFLKSKGPLFGTLKESSLELASELRIKIYLGVPFKVKEKLYGIVFLFSPEGSPLIFHPVVKFVMETAIESGKFFEKVQNYKEWLDKLKEVEIFKGEIQDYLSRMGYALCSTSDLNRLLKIILEICVSLLRAASGSLYLIEGRNITTQVTYKPASSSKENFELRMQQSLINVEDVAASSPEREFNSYIGIPLLSKDEIKGLINIYDASDRVFNISEVELIFAFATQAVLAIENAQLFENQSRKAREATELYQAIKNIAQNIDYKEVVSISAVEVSRVAEVDRSLIFLLNEERKDFWLASSSGLNPEQGTFFSFYRLPLNKFSEKYLDRLKKAEYVDLKSAPSDFPAMFKLFQILPATSCLLIPLLLKERLIGFIYLDDSKTRKVFTQAQIGTVMTLSLQIGMAIQRSKLVAQLGENFNQLRVLYNVSTSITGTLSLEKLFKLIVTRASQLTKINSFSLLIWDEEKEDFKTAASVNLPAELLKSELCSKIVKMVAQKKKPSVFYMLPSDKDKISLLLKDIGKWGILSVPLVIKGRIVGILNCFADDGYRISDQEVRLFRNFANQATVAFENARLYDVIKKKVKELATLFEVGKTLTSTLQIDNVLKEIIDIISRIVKADAIGIFLFDPSLEELSLKIGLNLGDHHYQKRIKVGEGISGIAVKTGRPMILTNLKKDSASYKFPGSVLRDGLNTILSLPMKSKGEVVGLLNLYLKEIYYYNQAEINLLSTFANQAAIAIENAKLYQEQMEMAKVVQSSLTPQRPVKFGKLDISYKYIPSKELSGDYFDFIPLTGSKLVVNIADVSGKGTHAAIYTARSKYILKALANSKYEPHKALEILNKILEPETEPELFISVFYVLIDLKHKVLRYSSAGHEPALFYSKEKDQVLVLEAEGLLIGVDKKSKYQLKEIKFSSGDMLVLYTDGITEARSKKKEAFSQRRLERIIKNSHNYPAKKIAEIVYQNVWKFTFKKLVDDFTLFIVKF